MQPTCLVVDDSPVVRKLARRMLEARGFAVEEAENGARALTACERRLPHCVLLDWNMPVMDGIDFLQEARTTFGSGRPPVVLCAAENDMASIERAIALGAREYVMKPFDAGILVGALARAGVAAAARTTRTNADNEASFFRDERSFTHLREKSLPRLLENVTPSRRIRIWCAAAGTGQEAYSLAMILADLTRGTDNPPAEIIATDIARDRLARARDGLYTQFEIQHGLPMRMLARHFRKEGTMWRISQPLRQMTRFRECDVVSDPRPAGAFDIVFCQGVLGHFDESTKARALDAIADQMRPEGFLYLGAGESIRGLTDRFAPVPSERGIHMLAPPAAIQAPVPAMLVNA